MRNARRPLPQLSALDAEAVELLQVDVALVLDEAQELGKAVALREENLHRELLAERARLASRRCQQELLEIVLALVGNAVQFLRRLRRVDAAR